MGETQTAKRRRSGAFQSDLNQCPKVQQVKIRALKAKMVMRSDGVHGVDVGLFFNSLIENEIFILLITEWG